MFKDEKLQWKWYVYGVLHLYIVEYTIVGVPHVKWIGFEGEYNVIIVISDFYIIPFYILIIVPTFLCQQTHFSNLFMFHG